ncbi:MAG: OmpA family protein [Myxococcales bacterium]|nr:OmpA family protein [Myxococcales bacterium]
MTFWRWNALGMGTLLVGAGCATTPHSDQFNQAQQAYREAQQGVAAQLTPDEMLEAENLLEKAESAENGSYKEEQYAYLAERQANIAQANAAKRAMQDELQNVQTQREELQARAREIAEQRASTYQQAYQQSRESQEDLARQLEQIQAERARLEEQLGSMSNQLEGLAEVVREKDELVLTINGSVLFESNESNLMATAERNLENVAKVLKSRQGWENIVVVGHTDARGTEQYNRQLSEARAESVRSFLVESGIPADRVEARGKGESDPIATNATPAGRANNRRVELRIKDRTGGEGGEQAMGRGSR